MSQVQVEQKSYQMPPQDGITVAHFLTIADIERSLRFYETVFGGRVRMATSFMNIRVADI